MFQRHGACASFRQQVLQSLLYDSHILVLGNENVLDGMSELGLYGPITNSAMTFSGTQKEPNSCQKRRYGQSHTGTNYKNTLLQKIEAQIGSNS